MILRGAQNRAAIEVKCTLAKISRDCQCSTDTMFAHRWQGLHLIFDFFYLEKLDHAFFHGRLLFPSAFYSRGEKTFGCRRIRTQVSWQHQHLAYPWPLGLGQGNLF